MMVVVDFAPRVFEVVTARRLFRITEPEGGWPEELRNEYLNWFKTHLYRLEKKVTSGKITEAQRTTQVYEKSLAEVVKRFRLNYEDIDL
jgi:hypothetical protein